MPLLHWLIRDDDIKTAARAPYRLLEEDARLSCGDRDTGNMLIQGDNLGALKALLLYYAGKVNCIFLNPPYNTRTLPIFSKLEPSHKTPKGSLFMAREAL